MADQRRIKRFADLIKRQLAHIIETKLSDPDKGFITLTHVKVSADLGVATIYYTIMGDQEQQDKTQAVLNRSVPFLKNELKPFISTRKMPDLRFFYDEALDRADKIQSILDKINNDSRNTER
ncbi:MAG: 30S ribosome-binding factor RbfA [Caldithrix sp.]|nr:30S ribosome-binding factor RbfA [Caldithrix sp.]